MSPTIESMLDRIEYWSSPWELTADDASRRHALASINSEVKRLRAALAKTTTGRMV